jgi:hypothetical protein
LTTLYALPCGVTPLALVIDVRGQNFAVRQFSDQQRPEQQITAGVQNCQAPLPPAWKPLRNVLSHFIKKVL